jgi:hypothetical protein
VALGGTSYAAAKITSADIKNGTIQNKDLNSKTKVTAKSVHNDNATALASNKTVLSLNLKKGSYLVTAKAYAEGGSTPYADAECTLVKPNGSTADTAWWWSGFNETGYATLSNQAVMHLGTTGTVQLKCSGGNATLLGKKLTALRVASVTDLTGADVSKVPAPRLAHAPR